ncbi:MAG: sodium:solute symporter, partial [Phycisphaerae bacterium]|nr:sodium:solute symporter [Phycisphaerae bacterium]
VLVDWLVLAAYFSVLAVTGWILARREQRNARDYFLASRSMPVWAAAVSLMATALSGATFIGGPEQSFRGNLTFLVFSFAQIIGILIVAAFFIPAFYRNDVVTVYGLLERRFGAVSKQAASWMFMIGRVFASGARLFIAALAASVVLFGETLPWQISVAIAAMVVVGIAYTLMGGIAAVVWSDVIQAVVFVTAAIAALVVLAGLVPADFDSILAALREPAAGKPSKLTVIDPGVGEFGSGHTFSVMTALTGLVILSIGSFGTDHDLAQRLLTCRSAKRGAQAAILGIVLAVPVTALFLVVGLGLWVFYQRADLMGGTVAPLDDSRTVFLNFIMDHMPTGMGGLMMAGLFAAGLSSFNSALNAMASTFVSDFYQPRRPGRDPLHYLRVGRIAVCAWGVVLGAFAVASIFIQKASGTTLIDYALGVMVFAYAGLVAVYLAAIFTRRGNDRSVIAALVVGFVCVALLKWQPWATADTRLDLAFPWQLLIATTLAFGVCCLGRADAAREQESATGRERDGKI